MEKIKLIITKSNLVLLKDVLSVEILTFNLPQFEQDLVEILNLEELQALSVKRLHTHRYKNGQYKIPSFRISLNEGCSLLRLARKIQNDPKQQNNILLMILMDDIVDQLTREFDRLKSIFMGKIEFDYV